MMKINFLKTLLLLLCAPFALSATAYEVELDGIFYNLDYATNEAIVTCKYTDTSNADTYTGTVIIPEAISYDGEEFTVTAIGERAFFSCNTLEAVELPATIYRIDKYAFNNCSKLKSFVMPQGIRTIETATFYNCSQLEDVTLPSSLRVIGENAFANCRSLRHIDLPASVTEIKTSGFRGCGLEEVVLPASLTQIGNKGFNGCRNLASITFNDNLERMGEQCFEGAGLITTVDLPASLTYIDILCFAECPKLTSAYCRNPRSVIIAYTGTFFNSPIERLLVPNNLLASYANNMAWKDVPSILPLKCGVPSVSFTDAGMVISTNTNLSHTEEQETFTYSVEVSDVVEDATAEAKLDLATEMLLTYDVSVQASVPYVEPSDTRHLAVCWLDAAPELVIDGEEPSHTTGVEYVPAQRAVLIESHDGQLSLSGLTDGEQLVFYSLDGRFLGGATASGDCATFSTTSGQVVIVRVGTQAFKVRVK